MTEMIELEMPTLKEVLEEAGGNEQLLKELSHKLRLWLNQQLHLPQDISDQRLTSFICCSKFNVEKVKKRLDTYYAAWTLYPEVSTFDPLSDNMIQFYKHVQMISMPKLTPQNCRVLIARFVHPDSSLFDMIAAFKYTFLLFEILTEEDIVTSDFMIMDATNFRIGHALKFASNMKRIGSYLEARGRRVKAIHIINAPEFIDWLMTIIKSVMNIKIFNRFYVHTSGIESLYGIIPKSILPADYGGEQLSTDTIAAMWRAKLNARREWFLEQEKAFINASFRSNSIMNPNDLFGVPGTFQKLDID